MLLCYYIACKFKSCTATQEIKSHLQSLGDGRVIEHRSERLSVRLRQSQQRTTRQRESFLTISLNTHRCDRSERRFHPGAIHDVAQDKVACAVPPERKRSVL